MADLYLTDEGDIIVNTSGDIALTQTTWRDDVQQIYVRLMTDEGDYVLYPTLGSSLSKLFGQPQSPETGQLGVELINAALERENRFVGKPVTVTAVPIGSQTIRFDVTMKSGSREQIRLSVEQNLGVQ